MKLKEIMSSDVEVIHPDDTLQTAAQKMRDRDIGFLPVMDGDELIGVVTDRDLVVRAIADGVKLKTTIGRDIATSPGIYCFDDQDVNEAAQLMQEHHIRRLVILSRNDGSVNGVISLGDLAVNSAPDKSGEVLQSVSEGFVKTH
jgi:CBS domain-containing protein